MSTQRTARGGAEPAEPTVRESGANSAELGEDTPKQGAIGHLSSDEELQQAVCSALIETPELDTSDIAVRAANARVVLSGTVRTDSEQHLALRIAEKHAGAGAVDSDELHVRQQA